VAPEKGAAARVCSKGAQLARACRSRIKAHAQYKGWGRRLVGLAARIKPEPDWHEGDSPGFNGEIFAARGAGRRYCSGKTTNPRIRLEKAVTRSRPLTGITRKPVEPGTQPRAASRRCFWQRNGGCRGESVHSQSAPIAGPARSAIPGASSAGSITGAQGGDGSPGFSGSTRPRPFGDYYVAMYGPMARTGSTPPALMLERSRDRIPPRSDWYSSARLTCRPLSRRVAVEDSANGQRRIRLVAHPRIHEPEAGGAAAAVERAAAGVRRSRAQSSDSELAGPCLARAKPFPGVRRKVADGRVSGALLALAKTRRDFPPVMGPPGPCPRLWPAAATKGGVEPRRIMSTAVVVSTARPRARHGGGEKFSIRFEPDPVRRDCPVVAALCRSAQATTLPKNPEKQCLGKWDDLHLRLQKPWTKKKPVLLDPVRVSRRCFGRSGDGDRAAVRRARRLYSVPRPMKGSHRTGMGPRVRADRRAQAERPRGGTADFARSKAKDPCRRDNH